MPLPLLNSAARPLDCLHPQDVHVLLVDDEQLSRLVVGNLLRKCDYKVTVVESGAQALDVLRQSVPGTFQLILTDVMMPEVDGLDILRYVRSNAQLADLPVIMMSANEQKDAVFEAIKGGAEEYLVKPVTKKEVQNIWQHVWKRLSARTLQRDSSWPDLQGLQGSAGDDAAALANGLPSSNTNSSQLLQQQQQRRQQHVLVQSMQQLHRAQQQVVQQPDPNLVRRPQQQQRQQQVLLSQWLQRPKRTVNPKECTWVFCEVLLLVRNMAAACSSSSSGRQVSGVPSGFVRPSRLLLHSNGRVTAAAGASVDPQEEAVYASPEELTAAAAGSSSSSSNALPALDSSRAHSYSLGVLFFDLLYAAPSGSGVAGRWKALSDLRQRIMPPAFLQQYPQEAALVLSLLHPEPAARPSLQQLLSGELLSAYCGALQERHQQQQGRDQGSLVFFLDIMHGRKQAEVQQVQQTVSQLDAQIAAVEAALREMQGSRGQGVPQHRAPQQQQQGVDGKLRSAEATLHGCSSAGAAAAVATAMDGGKAASAAVAAAEPSAAAAAASGDDMVDDDLEMERREMGRNKRRRIEAGGGAGLMQFQQHLLLERSGSANSGNAAAASPDAAITPSASVGSKWERVADRFPVLEGVFLKHRHSWEKQQDKQQHDERPRQQQQQQGSDSTQLAAAGGTGAPGISSSSNGGGMGLPGYLQSFGEDLWAYSRYSSLAVRGTVRAAADVLGGGSAMVCAAAFDRDDEYVATAGVSKRIRIFEYASITSSACGGGCGCTAGKAAAPGMGGFSRGGLGGGTGSPISPSASAGIASSAAPATGVDGIVYPVLELSSRSRLSCVVWSSYVKAHIASSDYEGVVQLWDANTGGELVQFEEHAKRAWAVDFSRLEPTRLVSSSDDCTVKLWSIHQESSLATLQLHANVCSVQFSPESPHLLACGCANYRTYLYDLRQTAQPLACVHGHKKAVSYVRWLNGDQLVTASTDNTLKLWSVPAMAAAGTSHCSAAAGGPGCSRDAAAAAASACVATYAGHTNQRNFIGLAVLPGSPGDGTALGNSSNKAAGGYIACGSETNEVYAYHSSVPVPIAAHNFAAPSSAGGRGGWHGDGGEGGGLQDNFVSCVTWNRRQGTIVAANSAGHIKVLELV